LFVDLCPNDPLNKDPIHSHFFKRPGRQVAVEEEVSDLPGARQRSIKQLAADESSAGYISASSKEGSGEEDEVRLPPPTVALRVHHKERELARLARETASRSPVTVMVDFPTKSPRVRTRRYDNVILKIGSI
jgi:uncharacterized protein (UPF0128 family)